MRVLQVQAYKAVQEVPSLQNLQVRLLGSYAKTADYACYIYESPGQGKA